MQGAGAELSPPPPPPPHPGGCCKEKPLEGAGEPTCGRPREGTGSQGRARSPGSGGKCADSERPEPRQPCGRLPRQHLLPGHGLQPSVSPGAATGRSLAFFKDHLLLGLETDPPSGVQVRLILLSWFPKRLGYGRDGGVTVRDSPGAFLKCVSFLGCVSTSFPGYHASVLLVLRPESVPLFSGKH